MQVLILMQQALYPLSHFPSLSGSSSEAEILGTGKKKKEAFSRTVVGAHLYP